MKTSTGFTRTDADLRLVAEPVERMPALSQSARRLYDAARHGAAVAEMVPAIESDVALTLAVLRAANRGARRGTVATIPDAIRTCGATRLAALAESIPTVDLLDPSTGHHHQEVLRLHALAVHRTMDRLATLLDRDDYEWLMCAALIHDCGKLALLALDPAYGDRMVGDGRTSLQRLVGERARGGDHAQVGGELARRWGFPDELAAAVELHHADDAGERARLVRLADELTHYAEGHVVDLGALATLSSSVGIARAQLGVLLYELPHPITTARPTVHPCPLSTRELEVLRALAGGKVYKQIAAELGLSVSTVRSHLHRIYTRIGAVDRTQAILHASELRWI
jgi:putative nucleotidyltransferase with HDIG domain